MRGEVAFQAVKLRHISTCLDGKRIPLNSDQRSKMVGQYPYWGANGIVDYVNDYIFDEPLVLVGEDGAPFADQMKEKAFFVNEKVWVNNHIHVLKINSNYDPKYVTYALNAVNYLVYIEGSTRDKLTQDKLKEIKIFLPPFQTQQKIADYLDRETARIDALIEAKEKMLALLEEKRQTLISHAVTKGLDPDVKMKDSGIEWLGEIPAHWEVERAKHIFQVRDERTETGDEELLTVSHITGVTPRSEKQVYMFEAEDKVGYKKCYPGDLVINTLWAWMGAMGVAPISGIVSPDYHVYVTNGTLLPEFIDFLCHSRPFVAEVNRWSKGVWSSRLRLYPENFFEIEMPIPPIEEQKQIVKHIDTFTEKSLQLSKEIEKSIVLLKERRAALISAAVTGKINKG